MPSWSSRSLTTPSRTRRLSSAITTRMAPPARGRTLPGCPCEIGLPGAFGYTRPVPGPVPNLEPPARDTPATSTNLDTRETTRMYAVIQTGGKQYRVGEGDRL